MIRRRSVLPGRICLVGPSCGAGERTVERYLKETELLDFSHPDIERLFASKEWDELPRDERIRQIYEFVRDVILFGYNEEEAIPASQVLAEGMGQCNTKGILLMALLRRGGFPCRFHAFTVQREIQRGTMLENLYHRLPPEIQHSWVEVLLHDKWVPIEGFIVDSELLTRVQKRFSSHSGHFCGYAIATDDLQHPRNIWSEEGTFIQNTAIVEDLSIYDSPDAFYEVNPSNISGLKSFLWKWFFYSATNENVRKLRRGIFPANAEKYVEMGRAHATADTTD